MRKPVLGGNTKAAAAKCSAAGTDGWSPAEMANLPIDFYEKVAEVWNAKCVRAMKELYEGTVNGERLSVATDGGTINRKGN